MQDSRELMVAIDEIVSDLLTGELTEDSSTSLEMRILEVATVHSKGVINVMGRVSDLIKTSGRFDADREARIQAWFRMRGVGTAMPELVCF